ncbi:hypothetical protein [Roseovarius sp. TE539]|uniref:hypothetical protein n=1 Tax=Roseovarius sp. TE539 TaxID=2249812 RepID=UPI0011BF4D69
MIDGHLHVERSKLSVSSFAELVVAYGTTSVVSGLDQILVVSGLEGVRHFLDEANAGPMTIHWGAPCKTPYTMPRSTVNHYFGPDDHRATHEWPECIGIWETVREFIQEEDDDVIEALEIARRHKLPVFGCSPMCKGSKLAGYASAGIRLDHESYDVTEALEKMRNGMFILIRESSISHFLDENIQLATKYIPQADHRISLCTDDDQRLEENGDQEHGIGIWREGRGRPVDLTEGGGKTARQDRPTRRGTGFFGRCLQSHPRPWRRKEVKKEHRDLSVRRQCSLLSLGRPSLHITRAAKARKICGSWKSSMGSSWKRHDMARGICPAICSGKGINAVVIVCAG